MNECIFLSKGKNKFHRTASQSSVGLQIEAAAFLNNRQTALTVCAVMESNGGDLSRILQQIETLKAGKSEIEQRISVLEAQLNGVAVKDDAKSSSYHSISVNDSTVANGLSPDMIYRYSRHLLLPSYGVQGLAQYLFLFIRLNLNAVN